MFQRRVLPSLLAGTALVAIVIAVVTRSPEPTVPSASPDPAPPTGSVPAPSATTLLLPLEKPDVKLTPRALTYRSADDRDFASQLKPALDAYRAGDYGRADEELAALAARHPQAVEVHFYQGISRLFLSDLSGADRSLAAAERVRDESFATDVAWYRAIVDERLGRIADARARLTALCSQGNHARQPIACEMADKLR